MRTLFVLLVLSLVSLACSEMTLTAGMKTHIASPLQNSQAPPSAPQATGLRVHVVPHSHDDVGWLKTVDEYFYGANMSIQSAGVQYTIDTVIAELLADSAKKFIYVEMAFFWRWWNQQTPTMQNRVKNLVKDGQLEFINGGWCMHDEAGTYFEDMIDQMTLGHRFLHSNFGVVPKIGWQIDPFGHSMTNAFIDAEAGFEALFFARMDYQDFAYRMPTKSYEMNWMMSKSMPSTKLLTGMMINGYCDPSGFMFEYGDEPIMDDPRLENYNFDSKVNQLVTIIREQASHMRHNEVMLSWGCDFMYMNAFQMFKNIEKLMTYINANNATYNMTMFYSTPSIYAEAIQKDYSQWPSKSDDFFPYADGAHSYWTGYFTSRPALKGYVRQSNNVLQATTQLYSLVGSQNATLRQEVFALQEAMGVLQHHDAVSGTEQQHVANDYAKRLYVGTQAAQDVISKVIGSTLGGNPPMFTFCPLLNQSICAATNDLNNGKTIAVTAYNTLPWTRNEYVILPIPVGSVKVLDSNGVNIPSQVAKNANPYSVTFNVTVPPLGYAVYFVVPGGSSELSPSYQLTAPVALTNEYLTLNLDANGNFVSYTNKKSNITTQVQQTYLYYISSTGNAQSSQASGAYIFRPASNTPVPFGNSNSTPQVTVSNGTLFTEVYKVFSNVLSQRIRVYAGQNFVEVVDVVGPIDVSDGVGKEVITRYSTDLNNQNVYFTDSNGLELQNRTLNYRPSWPYQIEEAVSGNYYPINSIINIRDPSKSVAFSWITDRSRGGASINKGQIEGMIQRATTMDDGRGVDEPINEHNIISSTSWLTFDTTAAASAHYRPSMKRLNHPLVLAFASTASASAWSQQYKTSFAPLKADLPANVQVLTFAPTEIPGTYILRFHHIFEVNEDATLSKPVTFDMNNLFTAFVLTSVKETQLTSVAAASRDDAIRYNSGDRASKDDAINVTLNPMEIRTFVVQLQARTNAKVNVNGGNKHISPIHVL